MNEILRARVNGRILAVWNLRANDSCAVKMIDLLKPILFTTATFVRLVRLQVTWVFQLGIMVILS